MAAAQDPEQPDQPGPSEEAPETTEPTDTQTIDPAEEALEEAEEEEAEVEEEALAEEVEEEEEADLGPQIGLSVLGVASVVGGILFLLEAGDSSDLADQEEASGGSPDRVADLRDRSDRESALGIVLTSLGVAMIGAATYLWVRYFQGVGAPPDPEDDPADPDVSFAPSFAPDWAGFVLSGTF